MANPEQLKILKKGVRVWNQWRTQDILNKLFLDLSGADLKGIKIA